jgi:hypothetical protein
MKEFEKMVKKKFGLFVAGLASIVAASTLTAAPASAAAFVSHPEDNSCTFEPGDVPGVDIFFPAKCTIITSDSGITTIVARGKLPSGYSLNTTFVGSVPCFGQVGQIVATVSGQVTATCHF